MVKGKAPEFDAGKLSFDEAASLCHLISTQNAFGERLAKEGKPTLLENCKTTRPFWHRLIAYLDEYS